MNKKGFTLIELLVVMVIIGILATAGFSAFSSAQKKGRDSVRLGFAKQLETGIQAKGFDTIPDYSFGEFANPLPGTAATWGAKIEALIVDDFGAATKGADPLGNTTARYVVCTVDSDGDNKGENVLVAWYNESDKTVGSVSVNPATTALTVPMVYNDGTIPYAVPSDAGFDWCYVVAGA